MLEVIPGDHACHAASTRDGTSVLLHGMEQPHVAATSTPELLPHPATCELL